MDVMRNSGLCIISFIGGILVGSAVTMLVTPKSGKEMRGSIRDLVNGELEKIRCRCNDIEQEIEESSKTAR